MIELILLWQFNAGWMVQYLSLWDNMLGVASWGRCGYILYHNLTIYFKFCPFEKLNVVKPWERGFVFVGRNHVYVVDIMKRSVITFNVTSQDAVYFKGKLYYCSDGKLYNGTENTDIPCNWLVYKNNTLYVFTNWSLIMYKEGNAVNVTVPLVLRAERGDVCDDLVAYTNGNKVVLMNLASKKSNIVANVSGVGEIYFSPDCSYLAFTSPYTGQVFLYSVKTMKIVASKTFMFPLSKCPTLTPAVAIDNRTVYVGTGDGWVQAFALTKK